MAGLTVKARLGSDIFLGARLTPNATIVGTEGKDLIVVNTDQYAQHELVVVDAKGGNDRVVVKGHAPVKVQVFGGDGNDVILVASGSSAGPAAFDGGAGSDVLTGGAGDDVAWGQDGNDYIDLGDGYDVGYGGNGADRLIGGRGQDTLFGNYGEDTLAGGYYTWNEVQDDYELDFLYGNRHRDTGLIGLGDQLFVEDQVQYLLP